MCIKENINVKGTNVKETQVIRHAHVFKSFVNLTL